MTTPVTVATDGACIGNPGPAGWGWVNEDGTWGAGSLKHGTNNIGELTAILQAIQAHPTGPLIVQADSQYAINCVEKWGKGWRRKGWVKPDGAPVKNAELVAELLAAYEAHPDVKLEWVRGHAGHRLNGWADNRATDAAARGARGVESVEGTVHGHAALTLDEDAPTAGEDRPRRDRGPAPSKKPSTPRKPSGKWRTQTELGAEVGLSAIAVGKALVSAGLRDAATKLPTERALQEKLAKVRTIKRSGQKIESAVWSAEVLAHLR